MQEKKLEIRNLGPIKECNIDLGSFNVITGKQSSGKSTVAKSLYFFLKLKDILGRLAFECHHPGVLGDGRGDSLNRKFKQSLTDIFGMIFDVSSISSGDGSFMRMNYAESIYVQVDVNESVVIKYSNKLRNFIHFLESLEGDSLEKNFNDSLQKKIDGFFQIDYSPIYIPAGRGLMTVLGGQFDLFYATLDDDNRNLIDLCTRDYFETVIRLRPLFGEKVSKAWKKQRWDEIIKKTNPYILNVLNGEYYYSLREEYIQLVDGPKIRVNKTSSGQQEALWIVNILLYYTANQSKKFYIIEEPESNLFPESQQNITKFLTYIANSGNPMLINTHSPYVLGELNNLVYAGSITERRKRTYEVIEKDFQLKFESIRAFFFENGIANGCLDEEIKQIDNTKLDEISGVINEEYDKLLRIERGK